MNIVRHQTPDTGWAWVISFSCASINGLTFGLIRSFGVFFFYLRKEFNVSRQVASWPFALCTSLTYLSGPISGFLISYFQLRSIVFVGILLTSLGFGLCFFVTDLSQFILLIGFVHGFGIGLSFMQTPVILAQYFSKFHATATAISYAGGTVGSFVFPPLIEYFIEEFGLKGSFLIISAILLNGLPCALLLRPAIEGNSYQLVSTTQDLEPLRTFRSINKKLTSKRQKERWTSLRKSSIDLFIEKQFQNSKLSLTNSDILFTNGFDFLISPEMYNYYSKQVKSILDNFNETEKILINLIRVKSKEFVVDSSLNPFEDYIEVATKNKYSQTSAVNRKQQFLQKTLTTIKNPMYIILLITHVSFQWAWMTYQMVIFDFAIDQQLTRMQSLLMLISFAISDLIGRIVSGYAADRKLIKKNHIVSICILLIGFLILVNSIINTYQMHLLLNMFLGFICGVIIVLFNLLTMEYVGLDNLPVALSVSAFCVGLSSLFRPYVIGIFRDVIGSYDGLFQFVGTLSLVAALLWLMEPFAILQMKRKNVKKSFHF